MAYRLQDDEPIVEGLARIASEQIERSLAAVADEQLARPEVVHDVRKRCKKLRGLLRLARTALPDVSRAEDDQFRDASRKLANVRQASATIVALESLCSSKSHSLPNEVVARVRDALAGGHRSSSEETGIDAQLAEFTAAMQEARRRIEQWPSTSNAAEDISAAILDGFRKTYRRGRRALRIAQQVQADEYLHEFRKWAKYHWHHTKLLEKVSPKKFRRRGKCLVELSDLLGDDRDLAALRHELLERVKAAKHCGGQDSTAGQASGHQEGCEPNRCEHLLANHADEVDQVVAAIDDRRGRLRSKAFRLARKLYREKPKTYARQLERRWKFAA